MSMGRRNTYQLQDQKKRILLRENIVVTRRQELLDARFIFIEAQAGQGKTTIANQILDSENFFHFWFNVSEEDKDPVSFFSSLLQGVKKGLPGFESPFLKRLGKAGDLGPADIAGGITPMIAAVEKILRQQVTFVFDDLQYLENHRPCLDIIDHLLESAPESLRFLLLSRTPVPLKSRKLVFGKHTVYLTDEDLVLSFAESIELHTLLTGRKTSISFIKRIHEATEGWTMGLVLASAIPDTTGFEEHESINLLGLGLEDYFFSELFSAFSPDRQRQLVALSCLDEIPSKLAVALTGDDEVVAFLTNLMERNFFVRLLDTEGEVFGFHALFREFLQSHRKCLSVKKRQDYLAGAAEFWNGLERYGKGMLYLARAELFEELEKVIPVYGSELMAQSRLVNLGQIIEQIPAEIVAASSWFSYFVAILLKERETAKAGQGFERALTLFIADSDVQGELLTLSQLIYYHVLFSGTLAAGIQYLNRAAVLYDQVGKEENTLSYYDRILTVLNIGTGFLYLFAEMELARNYLVEAVQLAERNGCTLLATQGRTSLVYTYMLAGQRSPAAELIERNYITSLINSESKERSLTKFFTEVDFLYIFGETQNFSHNLQIMKNKIGGEFLEKTIVGPLSRMWEASVEISLGNLQGARQILEMALLPGSNELSPHVESEYLRLLAFIFSFEKSEMENAVRTADRSMELRKKTGGVQFELFAWYMLGTVYVRAGQVDYGLDLLDRAITVCAQKKLISLSCSSYLFRAYCHFITGNKQKGEDDLQRGLTLMRENSQDFVWGWCPSIMKLLLTSAVESDIECRFCRELARKRLSVAILASGEAIPLLRVQILGVFSIDCGDGPAVEASDFTPVQRHLLAILLASGNLQVNTRIIQAELWPDASEELAKKSFDTLLSRFRKSLDTKIHPNSSKNYLVLKKGILSLVNCKVDAREFTHFIEKGLEHYQKGEFWQAGNCFYPAMKLWRGCVSKEIFYDDHSYAYCEMLQNNMADMAAKWGENLIKVGYQEEALQAVEKAWSINPTHEGLVRQLYLYHLGENNGVQARQLLKKYAAVLRQEDYSEAEINSFVSIVSDSTWT